MSHEGSNEGPEQEVSGCELIEEIVTTRRTFRRCQTPEASSPLADDRPELVETSTEPTELEAQEPAIVEVEGPVEHETSAYVRHTCKCPTRNPA